MQSVPASPPPPARRLGGWKSMSAQEARLAWMLILPTALIVFGLVLFPAIFSVWISFHKVGLTDLANVFSTPWVGLDNYAKVVDDFAFGFQSWRNWGAALNSIFYSFVATIFTIAVGLLAALLLNRPFHGRGLARGLFLFPYIAPVVSVAFVWRWLLEPTPAGVVNDLLMRMGLIERPLAYLATPGLAMVLVILFQGWRYFPFAMLMILARLQAIDNTLYEAADVDGANGWNKFRSITLPELRYVVGALFLLRLMWTFNKFDDIFLLTGGGFGTKVLPVLTYEFSFRLYDFGRGAAAAMILLIILLIFMAVYSFTVMRGSEEE